MSGWFGVVQGSRPGRATKWFVAAKLPALRGRRLTFGTCDDANKAARLYDRAVITFGVDQPKLNFAREEYASEIEALKSYRDKCDKENPGLGDKSSGPTFKVVTRNLSSTAYLLCMVSRVLGIVRHGEYGFGRLSIQEWKTKYIGMGDPAGIVDDEGEGSVNAAADEASAGDVTGTHSEASIGSTDAAILMGGALAVGAIAGAIATRMTDQGQGVGVGGGQFGGAGAGA